MRLISDVAPVSCTTDADGTKEWYQNGLRHRDDGPAMEHEDGTKQRYQDGEPHRTDGPAMEFADGTKVWRQNGNRHRDGGPAVEYPNGTREWYQNGKRHRIDGPAVELANGAKVWYQNGMRHRIDGPAIEQADGSKEWYQNGWLHRADGPAIDRIDGTKEWRQNGVRLVTMYDDEVGVTKTDIPHRLVEAVISKVNLPDKVAFCNWLAFVVIGHEGAQVMQDEAEEFAPVLMRYLENLDEYVDMPLDWWYALLRDV